MIGGFRDRLRRAYRREFVDEVSEGLDDLAREASEKGAESTALLIAAILRDLRTHAEKPRRDARD